MRRLAILFQRESEPLFHHIELSYDDVNIINQGTSALLQNDNGLKLVKMQIIIQCHAVAGSAAGGRLVATQPLIQRKLATL